MNAPSPAWTEHVIWWHVYPLGFTGSDTTGQDRTAVNRLRHLEQWLDYIVELGANGLALGPVFRSSTHGYDTIDHFEVDPRLGTGADLEHLIEAAHSRGIRVMLDGVFNHVGREFLPLQNATSDSSAPERALFRKGDDGNLEVFEGHSSLVALDHANPEVAGYVGSVMRYWLEKGIDGWRLDAAYAVPPEFWARVLPPLREKFPDAYVVGEVLHGDYAGFVREGALDSVTQYELWQAAWHSIAEANFFELDWALQRHNEFLSEFAPYTFVGNHDVTRIATQISDERHRAHALVLLFTLGGTPSVYYGDERGFEAVKEERSGGDDAIRPAFPASPDDLPDTPVFALHQELIGLRRRHPWLHTATSRTLDLANSHYVYEVEAGGNRLVIALNIGDEPLMVAAAGPVLAGHSDGGTVPPHGWAVFG
jgi:cyclomaltodextrinase